MKLLITGADGFVGRWLVRAACGDGHDVVAAVLPGTTLPDQWRDDHAGIEVIEADIRIEADLARLAAARPDAVVHLAAVASGAAARKDPEGAMQVNGIATVWLLEALGSTNHATRFLYVSSGEVYGKEHDAAIVESVAVYPVSPYAASKMAAEVAAFGMCEGTKIELIIARPFPHTGPGQTTTYVLPALAARLVEARVTGSPTVRTGNLDAVRDFLDVRDVVRAYLLLLERGVPGEVYNVASGVGRRLSDCFDALAGIVGVSATAQQDAALLRPGDIPVLIGNPAKLRAATGWVPTISFEQTLQDLVDAQAH
ncbi:MAG: GDP-mannose 4,6-dehydratase [Gemmatimonadales bacterium]